MSKLEVLDDVIEILIKQAVEDLDKEKNKDGKVMS